MYIWEAEEKKRQRCPCFWLKDGGRKLAESGMKARIT
jgi:hypothetical protein